MSGGYPFKMFDDEGNESYKVNMREREDWGMKWVNWKSVLKVGIGEITGH